MRALPALTLLLAGALWLAGAASAQEAAKGPPQNPLPRASASPAAAARQLPAAPSAEDLQACLQQTGDYVTRGKTVIYVIGIVNTCARRLRCEIYASVIGARGSSLGHSVMKLGPAGSGAEAKQTYTMRVKAAGGIAQVSRDCKVL